MGERLMPSSGLLVGLTQEKSEAADLLILTLKLRDDIVRVDVYHEPRGDHRALPRRQSLRRQSGVNAGRFIGEAIFARSGVRS
jgi:hypothetical protein